MAKLDSKSSPTFFAPPGQRVNDAITVYKCQTQYGSVKDSSQYIRQLGVGTCFVKVDQVYQIVLQAFIFPTTTTLIILLPLHHVYVIYVYVLFLNFSVCE